MNLKDKRAAIDRLIAEQQEIIRAAQKRIAELKAQNPADLLTIESLIPRPEFKRNYQLEVRAALDDALNLNAVAGLKARDGQREKGRKGNIAREKNKEGVYGGSLQELITSFQPNASPGEAWDSFRDELREWSGSAVEVGERNGRADLQIHETQRGIGGTH